MPTPVGPAPRDPDDPDFWDWGPPDEGPARRHPTTAVVALVVVAALLLLIVLSVI